MRRYHVTTFGCQMNAHDSERIKGMLEELGLGESATQEDADVLVFNTCTIRESRAIDVARNVTNGGPGSGSVPPSESGGGAEADEHEPGAVTQPPAAAS